MYLARGILNVRSRDVLRDLASPAELHRTVLRLLPDNLGASPRAQTGVLYRVDGGRDGGALLVVQSQIAPAPAAIPKGYFVGVAEDAFDATFVPNGLRVDRLDTTKLREGDRLLFRLRANTTRKVDTKTGADGKRRNGRRVPVRGDEARLSWLHRKAQESGFSLIDARVVEEACVSGAHGESRVSFAGTRFDGILEVTNLDAFQAGLANGIGPAKAFGFGLLSVRRAAGDPGGELLVPLGA